MRKSSGVVDGCGAAVPLSAMRPSQPILRVSVAPLPPVNVSTIPLVVSGHTGWFAIAATVTTPAALIVGYPLFPLGFRAAEKKIANGGDPNGPEMPASLCTIGASSSFIAETLAASFGRPAY